MLSTLDVVESSIKAYLVSLVFITDRATVRRRTDADEWPQLPLLNRTAQRSATATTKYGWHCL